MVRGWDTSLNLELEQLDMNNSFLHGSLKEKKLHGETRGIQIQTQTRFGMSVQEESIWT